MDSCVAIPGIPMVPAPLAHTYSYLHRCPPNTRSPRPAGIWCRDVYYSRSCCHLFRAPNTTGGPSLWQPPGPLLLLLPTLLLGALGFQQTAVRVPRLAEDVG